MSRSQPGLENMVEEMLDSIVKKDEDTTVLGVDYANGTVQIETSIDLSSDYDVVSNDPADSPINRNLLRDDASGINSDVSIRIIFTVFSSMAVIHFATATIGILFYLVLLYDETKQVSIVILSISTTLCGVFYVLMTWQRKTYLSTLFAAQLVFFRSFVIASLSQLMGNELLYLMEFSYMFQTAALIIYTTKWPRNDPGGTTTDNTRASLYAKGALICVIIVSVVVWFIGILVFERVFFKARIWLWGSLMFPFLLLICCYKWWYIRNMTMIDGGRYSISIDDRKLAVIEYYSEPLIILWNKLTQQ